MLILLYLYLLEKSKDLLDQTKKLVFKIELDTAVICDFGILPLAQLDCFMYVLYINLF